MVEKLRLPKENEVLGRVEKMLGDCRMLVRCFDGKERIVRIPGKLRNRVWIKEGDIIIVKPWIVESDKRGDVVYRYTRAEVEKLIEMGYIKE